MVVRQILLVRNHRQDFLHAKKTTSKREIVFRVINNIFEVVLGFLEIILDLMFQKQFSFYPCLYFSINF